MRIDFFESRRTKLIYYGLLTFFFLCTGAFSSSLFDYYFRAYRVIALFFLMAVPVCVFLRERNKYRSFSLPIFLACLYALLICAVGAVHGLGLLTVPGSLTLNVDGVTASHLIRSNFGFSLFYLFFPMMLVGHFFMIKHLGVQVVIRLFSIAAFFSLCVLLYQVLWDGSFLNVLMWSRNSRYCGLATDPNAFALTVFLLVGIFALGISFERSRIVQFCYVGLIFSLVGASLFTGNRTVAGGLILLASLFPIIWAIAARQWSLKRRIAIGCLSACIMISFVVLLPVVLDSMKAESPLARRLEQTLNKYEAGGISAVFTKGEARGELFSMAWHLVKKSPLAGWGPGGFYREYPNLNFQKTGKFRKAFDSSLNHYLMIAVDLGVPALILNLLLILYPLWVGLRLVRTIPVFSQRLALVTVLAVDFIFLLLINTMPPSYFLGVMWSWTFLLTVPLVLFLDRYNSVIQFGKPQIILSISLLILVFWGAAQVVSGEYGYSIREDHGWWNKPYNGVKIFNRE